jgi:hypothetical protein
MNPKPIQKGGFFMTIGVMSKVTANERNILKFFQSVFCLMLALCFSNLAKADTTAVTTGFGFSDYGYANGAVGFFFTPTTNIIVTQVGYLDYGASAPIINFWSGTNYIFASFNLAPGSNNGQMIYTNVALTLFAGQSYSVTLQDGQDGTSAIIINVHTNFQVAPLLSNYASEIVLSGAFTNCGPTYYIHGPDFMFTNQTEAITPPDLAIAQASQTNVIVLWPALPSGFILQQNSALDTTNWTIVTNTVSTINGTNQISDITISSRFFRLYHP